MTVKSLPKDPSFVIAREAKAEKNKGDRYGKGDYANAHSGGDRNDVTVERWKCGRNNDCGRDGDKGHNCANRRTNGFMNLRLRQYFLDL